MSQSEALESSIKHQAKVIPFTVTYNQSLPNIGKTINRYRDLLKLSKDENLRHMHKTYRPIVAFKRPRSLNDYLVSSGLKENNEDTRSPVIICCTDDGVLIVFLSLPEVSFQVILREKRLTYVKMLIVKQTMSFSY